MGIAESNFGHKIQVGIDIKIIWKHPTINHTIAVTRSMLEQELQAIAIKTQCDMEVLFNRTNKEQAEKYQAMMEAPDGQ